MTCTFCSEGCSCVWESGAAREHPRIAAVAMHRPASRRPRRRRRRLPGRSDDVLLRGLRRRRVEDHRWRLDVACMTDGQLHDRGGRRARGRAVRPQRHLRRHRRSLHPQRRLARRRRLPLHATAARPGRTSAWATRAISGASSCTRSDPDQVYVAALGHAWGPNKRARRLPLAATAAAAGSTSCSRASAPARTTSRIDPLNPDVLYAPIWQAQRYPARA